VPKRPIKEPEYPEALEHIRRLRIDGSAPLTAEQEADFYARRGPVFDDDGSGWAPLFGVTRHRTEAIHRRGSWVYRSPGKAGADLPVPPYYWRMLQRQRAFETEASKVARHLAARWLHKPRQRKAEELAARIRHLAETITSGSRHKLIAMEVGCSVATVKRALSRRK
jgi:hypothetical protein